MQHSPRPALHFVLAQPRSGLFKVSLLHNKRAEPLIYVVAFNIMPQSIAAGFRHRRSRTWPYACPYLESFYAELVGLGHLKLVYEPLKPVHNEIRLLHLTPGKDNDPIDCTLERTSLAGPAVGSYEAVSYAWGSSSKSATIRCNNRDLRVPRSCERALRGLRRLDSKRTLWIDAACINQSDDAERGHQVAMMRKVYSKARRTVVWLGERKLDPNAVALALIFLLIVVEDVRGSPDNRYRYLEQHKALLEPHIPLLDELYTSAWFGRLWVVREITLCQRYAFISGATEIGDRSILGTASEYFDFVGGSTMREHGLSLCIRGLGIASMMWKMALRRDSPSKLMVLFSASFTFETTEPRDKVYALLGLLGDAHSLPALLTPDYSKSLAQVYRDAPRAAIVESNSLSMLYWVGSFRAVDDTRTQSGGYFPSGGFLG